MVDLVAGNNSDLRSELLLIEGHQDMLGLRSFLAALGTIFLAIFSF